MTDASKFSQNNPAPLIQSNYQGLILATNPAAVKIIGDINAKSIFEVFTNLDKKSLVRKTFQFEEVLSGRSYLFFAIKEKTSKSWYIYGSDITSLQTQKTAMLNILEDLDEERKILKESENRFKQIFEKVNAGVIVVNMKTKKIVMANLQMCNMVMYKQHELLKLTIKDIHPTKELAKISKLFTQHTEGEILEYEDVQVVRKDKTIITCSLNPSLITIEGDMHMLGIFNDVTHQDKMIETLKIKDYAIESSDNGIIITDLTGKIEYVNQAFTNLWNIEEQSVLLFTDIRRLMPKYMDSNKIFNNIRTTGEWKDEIKVQDGKTRYIKVEAHLVKDDFNEPLSIVFSYSDITEEKISQLIRLDFTNIAAHELKTPITPIKSFLNLIRDDPKSYGINATGLSYINTCLRNIGRLDRLVGDILDISKLEAGGMYFKFERFDIVSLINTEISDFNDVLQKNKLILSTEIPKKKIAVYGDKGRVGQVISNLLKNAIKFTEKGRILIKLSILEHKVQIDIIDTGLGIRKSDKNKLFTRFFQAEDITIRRTKGTGLGLVISKEIIKAHQGEIWADSPGRGKGSTFSFTLSTKKILKPQPRSALLTN